MRCWGGARSDQWNGCFLECPSAVYRGGKGRISSSSWAPGAGDPLWPVVWWLGIPAGVLCPQVYSSMERLSLLEERRTPPPTKRSLSEEKEDRTDGLAGLRGRERSWVIGSPEM